MRIRSGQPDGQLQADKAIGQATEDRGKLPTSLTGCLAESEEIQEAIAALEPLSREAPDEANIHFLLGKCYLRQGRRADATVAFTSARELQPKLEGAIRSAMEANGEDDDGEE